MPFTEINCSFGKFLSDEQDKSFHAFMREVGKKDYNNIISIVNQLLNNNTITKPIHLLDIGAHLGEISIGLSNSGLIDKAIAIEPNPANCQLPPA